MQAKSYHGSSDHADEQHSTVRSHARSATRGQKGCEYVPYPRPNATQTAGTWPGIFLPPALQALSVCQRHSSAGDSTAGCTDPHDSLPCVVLDFSVEKEKEKGPSKKKRERVVRLVVFLSFFPMLLLPLPITCSPLNEQATPTPPKITMDSFSPLCALPLNCGHVLHSLVTAEPN